MARKPKIDVEAAAVVISVRFSPEIIEMIDLLTDNRSEFVRDASWEKVEQEMKERDG